MCVCVCVCVCLLSPHFQQATSLIFTFCLRRLSLTGQSNSSLENLPKTLSALIFTTGTFLVADKKGHYSSLFKCKMGCIIILRYFRKTNNISHYRYNTYVLYIYTVSWEMFRLRLFRATKIILTTTFFPIYSNFHVEQFPGPAIMLNNVERLDLNNVTSLCGFGRVYIV